MNNNRSPAPSSSSINIGKMNIPSINALKSASANVKSSSGLNLGLNMKSLNKSLNSAANTIMNTTSAVTSTATSGAMNYGVIIAFVIAILILIGTFYQQISNGVVHFWNGLLAAIGYGPHAPVSPPVLQPTDDSPNAVHDTGNSREFVEKILPGRQEVFNISSNRYTYSDSEPLCKALGAELATYEQVKAAYDQGADWCNYGWVKGQMAVFPTQQTTWEQIQNGPEDQRNACGKPGVNGGYFDNPDLRYGVNCYGVKPPQKQHDAAAIASGSGQPLTPGALDFEKRVSKYRGEANSIGILPHSKTSWST